MSKSNLTSLHSALEKLFKQLDLTVTNIRLINPARGQGRAFKNQGRVKQKFDSPKWGGRKIEKVPRARSRWVYQTYQPKMDGNGQPQTNKGQIHPNKNSLP